MNDTPLVAVRALSKVFYRGAGRAIQAATDVNFSIPEGEFFGVVGESGCGKSTLGRLILRLIEPSGGQVFFEGQEISALAGRPLARLRRGMQMIFQNPFASFDPKRTLGFSLGEAARFHGRSREAAQERIRELLAYIKLPEETLSRLPKELSGGQLQRLAIARSLITEPRFIVADEPVSALDVSVQAQLLNLLYDLKRRLRLTMLFISHDIQVVEYLCDRVAVMYMGRIVEMAGAAEIFNRPLHPYTRALIAAAPKLDLSHRDFAWRDSLNAGPEDPPEEQRGCRFAPRCSLSGGRCLEAAPPLIEGGAGHYVACYQV
jgi:oligopeptide/dipeptide ABC transporter ATP-binding protein